MLALARRFAYGWLMLTVPLLTSVAGCGKKPSPWQDQPGPKVLVSFAPIYSFVKSVAGDRGQVEILMTTNGPHEAKDPGDIELRLAAEADLLFHNGLELDDAFCTKLSKAAGNSRLKLVALGTAIPESDLLEGACTHNHAPGKKHEHPTDPHVWLGIPQAIRMVEKIRDEYKVLDPDFAADYDRRAAEYIARLQQLHKDGLAAICGRQVDVVTFHESMNYFAESFNLNIVEVIQKDPGVEPDGKHLQDVINLCKKRGVKIIAIEPQFSPKAARTLSEAIPGARLIELNPFETADRRDLSADLYERVMRKNVQAIVQAMEGAE